MTNEERIRRLYADIHDAKARLHLMVYDEAGQFDPGAALSSEAYDLRERIGACRQMIRKFQMEVYRHD